MGTEPVPCGKEIVSATGMMDGWRMKAIGPIGPDKVLWDLPKGALRPCGAAAGRLPSKCQTLSINFEFLEGVNSA
jgi:hypothetical protein